MTRWFVLLILTLSLNGFAKEPMKMEPVWEWSAGLFAGWFPQYPASRDNQTLVLPGVFPTYRSTDKKLQDGIFKVLLFDTERITTTFSASGSLPAGSKGNEDREGMPALQFLGELGPKIIYHIYENRSEYGVLDLHIPIRAVASFQFDYQEEQGFTFEPVLAWKHEDFFGTNHGISLSLGALWATGKLHRYFYQVDNEFVTPDRPAFDAKEGYLGADVTMAYSIPYKDFTFFGILDVNNHSGAANEDSPLFINTVTYSVGLGFLWKFFESEDKVLDNPRF